MSTFNTKCPHCSGELEVESDWIGMELECPLCKFGFILQGEEKVPPAEKSCPFCGNTINHKAIRCKFCKQELPQEVQQIQAQDTGTGGKSRRKRYVFVALGGILFLAVATGGVFIARKIAIEKTFKNVIYQGHMVLEQPDSTQEDCTIAINDIEKTIKNFPSHNPDEANAMIKKLEAKQKEIAFGLFKDVLRKLRINNSNYPTQVRIRKKINLSKQCSIWVFPISRKQEVKELYQNMEAILESLRNWKKAQELGEKKIIDISRARAQKYHDKVRNFMIRELKSTSYEKPTMIPVKLENNSCDLSNIPGPVVLFAYEPLNFSDFKTFQGWYCEYTPPNCKEWTLE